MNTLAASSFVDGSTTLPALNFVLDTNTGIIRPGNDELGLVTGGGVRCLITNNGVQASGFLYTSTVVISQAGLVGTPSFTFDGDLNTGLWSPAADTAAMSCNGVEIARWNTTGFGIGKAPTMPLDVYKSYASGGGVTTQVEVLYATPSASDRADCGFRVQFGLTASSATNHLVSRAYQLTVTNTLTGGGVLQNARCFDLSFNSAASTTTTECAEIYIYAGTSSGTITNNRGIHIASLHGTNKWGIYDQSGGNWENTTGAVMIGAPTGGFKGTGTINAKAVYDDNVLLTDHIFDLAFDGKVKVPLVDKTSKKVKRFPGRIDPLTGLLDEGEEFVSVKFWKGTQVEISDAEFDRLARIDVEGLPLENIDETEEYTRINRHLPSIPGRDTWLHRGRPSTGEMITHLWETVERQALHIFELNNRMKQLEASVSSIVRGRP